MSEQRVIFSPLIAAIAPVFGRKEMSFEASAGMEAQAYRPAERYDARAGIQGKNAVRCAEWLTKNRHHLDPCTREGEALGRTTWVFRASAHALIHGHMLRAGIGRDDQYMKGKVRDLFLLLRQCGAANLCVEGAGLCRLTRKALGAKRGGGRDLPSYQWASAVVNWRWAGATACMADGRRRTDSEQSE